MNISNTNLNACQQPYFSDSFGVARHRHVLLRQCRTHAVRTQHIVGKRLRTLNIFQQNLHKTKQLIIEKNTTHTYIYI